MPPLFACSGCGVQIERSARSYLQQKGRLLCSSCRDRLDSAPSSEQRSDEPMKAGDDA